MSKDNAGYIAGLKTVHEAVGHLIDHQAKNLPINRLPFPGGGNGSATDHKNFAPKGYGSKVSEREGVKVHHGAHGEVYELAAGVRLSEALPQKAAPEIPIDRWLAASLLGDRCEDKAALTFAQETKGLTTGASGILLPEAFQGEWIDNLRSFMVLEAAGMTTATMAAGSVTSSRVLTDPPVGWRAEGAALAAGDPTFELSNLVARSLAVRVQATAELAQDSPDFGAQLMNVMGKALALEIDRVGLLGTGLANQPTGIINTVGVNAIPGVGTPTNYSKFVLGLQRLLENNVPLEEAEKNAIMSPRTWGTLEGLMAADGQPMMRPRALERTAFRPTTSIPNDLGVGDDESLAIMGDFRDLVLGVRMEATVEALRLQSYATNLQLEFVGWTRVDFMVRRPASFVVLNGITD